MPTDTYVPVIDISEHQGVVNFATMRDRGAQGLIIRTNHAQVVDKRCAQYVRDARLAGWNDRQLGAYTFCNPKRATGAASGKAFVDTVRTVFGHTRMVLMLDIEGYASESGSGPVIQGAAYVAWLREHIATVVELAPDCTLIAYTNAAFWDGDAYPVTGVHGPWVGDPVLAAELEWIVPRYPVYSAAGYAKFPLPTDPNGWPGWSFARAPHGPFPPHGATGWAGWQMSAGHNRQGPFYGCQSSDLDLNIVRQSAWERWTQPPPITPPPPPPPPTVEEDHTMKIKTPGQWFEKDGMDLRAISGGVEYGGLPGNEVTLTVVEMGALLATCRHTFGDAKAEMGAGFVTEWNAHKPKASTGGGTVEFPPYLGTITLQPGG